MTERAITIYTTSAFKCPYCVRAKTKLTELGYTLDERDVANPQIRAELTQRFPAFRTVPQIYAGDYRIGGCDDMLALARVGTLETIVEMNS